MIGRDCTLGGKVVSGLQQSLHLKPVRNSCLVYSYGLGADLSLPPCLSVMIGILTLAHKSDPRAEISGEIVWYDALAPGVLFAHAQVLSNSSSYHICGNEINW